MWLKYEAKDTHYDQMLFTKVDTKFETPSI